VNSEKAKKYLTGISAVMLVFNMVSPVTAATAPTKTATPTTANVVVTVGTDKSITVKGLSAGDLVKIAAGTTTDTLTASGTSVTFSGTKTDSVLVDRGGSFKVTVDASGDSKTESAALTVKFGTSYSTLFKASSVSGTINCMSGEDDTVGLKSLDNSGKVYIYAAATGGTAIASGSIGSGKTAKLTGEFTKTDKGSAYVSVKYDGMKESEKRLAVKFTSDVTDTPKSSAVTATNNFDGAGVFDATADVLKITGLTAGTKVKVYADAKTTASGLIFSGKVGSGKTVFSGVDSGLLSDELTAVYVTVQANKKKASKALKVSYKATLSNAPKANKIAIFNDEGKSDKVRVTGLTAGTKVVVAKLSGKVYDIIADGSVGSGKTGVTLSTSGLASGGGDLHVAVVESGKFLSKYTKVKYVSEN